MLVERQMTTTIHLLMINQNHSDLITAPPLITLPPRLCSCRASQFHRRSNIHLYPNDWKQLPIPYIPLPAQQPITHLVTRILEAKKKDATADVSDLEREVDREVSSSYESKVLLPQV